MLCHTAGAVRTHLVLEDDDWQPAVAFLLMSSFCLGQVRFLHLTNQNVPTHAVCRMRVCVCVCVCAIADYTLEHWCQLLSVHQHTVHRESMRISELLPLRFRNDIHTAHKIAARQSMTLQSLSMSTVR
jgi:hypothetical protein